MAEMSFQLDVRAAQSVLTDDAAALVEQAANAIANRATSMANSQSSHPPRITVSTAVGTIRRGQRAIGRVQAQGSNAHENYIGHMVLAKARDAGRVS